MYTLGLFNVDLADPPPPIDPYVLYGWSPSRTKMLPKSSLGPVLFGLTVVLRWSSFDFILVSRRDTHTQSFDHPSIQLYLITRRNPRLWPGNDILQRFLHDFDLELGSISKISIRMYFDLFDALNVVSKCTNNVFSQGKYVKQICQNSCQRLQSSGCHGLRSEFSNTFLS